MPEPEVLVINTGPILALIAACGDLALLRKMYREVIVPREVMAELVRRGVDDFGVAEVLDAKWLSLRSENVEIGSVLRKSLDTGEAAVIQTALDLHLGVVCIDETLGRRWARLHGLAVTGSLGVLLKAIERGHPVDFDECIARMRSHGVWLSERTAAKARKLAVGLRANIPHPSCLD